MSRQIRKSKTTLEQAQRLVVSRINKKGVETLNEGSYARNCAIQIIEAVVGHRVTLAPRSFTTQLVSRGRGRKRASIINAALANGRNVQLPI